MLDIDQEVNKRTSEYRRQQRDATDAAFREIAGKEKSEREAKTAELRRRREALANNKV